MTEAEIQDLYGLEWVDYVEYATDQQAQGAGC